VTDSSQPTHLALRWPFSSPEVVAGASSTSRWRPSLEYEAVTLVKLEPSGDVPGIGEDGRVLYSYFDSGHRGPDCIFQFFLGSLLLKVRT
jgi:hypothetical protein